jgi:long-chain acyl-CoA synthetase
MEAITVVTIPELIARRLREKRDERAFHWQTTNGKWLSCTWADVQRALCATVSLLQEIGIQAGDRVAVIGKTSPEWLLIDWGTMQLGAVVCGIDTKLTHDQIVRALALCAVRVCLVDNPALAASLRAHHASKQLAIRIAEIPDMSGILTQPMDHPVASINANDAHQVPDLANRPALIVLTSGTTGEARAVEFTHHQIILASNSVADVFTNTPCGDVVLCWLPLAHLFQRMMVFVAIERGLRVCLVAEPKNVVGAMAQFRPSVIVGVPAFF